MYFAAVAILMFLAPSISVVVELVANAAHANLIALIGKWFVFWAIGIRLFTAGIRQIAKPGLTAEGIFGIQGTESHVLVRELGFANVAMGVLAIASLCRDEWRLAGALVGGVYLFLAGLTHVVQDTREREETFAMVTDLAIAAVMATYMIAEL